MAPTAHHFVGTPCRRTPVAPALQGRPDLLEDVPGIESMRPVRERLLDPLANIRPSIGQRDAVEVVPLVEDCLDISANGGLERLFALLGDGPVPPREGSRPPHRGGRQHHTTASASAARPILASGC